jgi:hypothetical protein
MAADKRLLGAAEAGLRYGISSLYFRGRPTNGALSNYLVYAASQAFSGTTKEIYSTLWKEKKRSRSWEEEDVD